MCVFITEWFLFKCIKIFKPQKPFNDCQFHVFWGLGFPAFWLAGAGQPMRREACDNTHISLSSAVTTATEQSSLIEASRGELQVTAHNNHQSLSGSRRTLQYSILLRRTLQYGKLHRLIHSSNYYSIFFRTCRRRTSVWRRGGCERLSSARCPTSAGPSESLDPVHHLIPHTHTRQHQQSIMGLSSAYNGKWSRTVCDGAVLMRVPGDGRGAAAGRHHV